MQSLKIAPRRIFVAWVLALCAIAIATIPGSAVRPIAFPHELPPLPAASRGDAELELLLTQAGDKPAPSPVERARVTVIALVGGTAYLAGSAISDASGQARLSSLPQGEAWVLAEAPAMARASSHCVLGPGMRRLALELGPEHRLELTVRDDLGKALLGAEIEVIGADPLPIGARTGAQGVASIRRLSSAPWIVVARAAGYETLTRRSVREGEPLSLTLRKLGALRVAVVGSDETPVAASVLLAGSEIWPARSTETDSTGHVRLAALAAGSYALRATAGTRTSPIELGVSLGRGEEKEVVLRLGPGRFVDVRAKDGDEADAAPVAAARVTLAEGGLSPFPLEATTDRLGRARLGPFAPGPATLSAVADGYVSRGLTAVPDEGGPVTLVLVRAGTVTGRVVDGRGFPVDGASIEIIGTDPGGAPIDDDPRRAELREAHFDAALSGPRPLIPSGELGVVPGPVPPIPHGFYLPTADATAGAGPATTRILSEPWVTRNDGTFRAGPATPGRIRALVRHPQYVEALSDAVTLPPAGEAHVEVVLRGGGALEGRVVDAGGQPVSHVRVTVVAVRGSLERTTSTATDGTFAFASLPGAVTVTASVDDDPTSLPARASLTIPDGGRQTVTLTLPLARPSLVVRVRDDRGYPLDAVQLTAASVDPAVPLRSTAFTDARGEAHVANAAGVALRIEARSPGHAPKVVKVDGRTPSAPTGSDTLELTLELGQSVSGEVRSTHGDPVAGAEVAVTSETGTVHARTDKVGAYALQDLPTGTVRLVVRAVGYAPVKRELTIVISRAGLVEWPRVELSEEGSVEGVVLDRRGDPISGARVGKDRVPTYLAVGATPPGIAVTDARGRFHLGELPEGTISLEAYAADLGRATVDGVRVSSGRTTSGVELRLGKETDARAEEPASGGGVAVTLAEAGELKEVVLVDVAQGSEAERAGLAVGDVLLRIDGSPVISMADARSRLAGPLADDVVVQVRRGDATESLRVPREPVRK